MLPLELELEVEPDADALSSSTALALEQASAAVDSINVVRSVHWAGLLPFTGRWWRLVAVHERIMGVVS